MDLPFNLRKDTIAEIIIDHLPLIREDDATYRQAVRLTSITKNENTNY